MRGDYLRAPPPHHADQAEMEAKKAGNSRTNAESENRGGNRCDR